MMILTPFGLTLSGIIQSVPVPVSFSINAVLILWVWMVLRKQRTDELSARIVNHIGLLIGAWVTFSVFIGLFFTFDLLESASNPGLFEGFLFGFRIAMSLVSIGVFLFCAPLAWWIKTSRGVTQSRRASVHA